MSNERNYNELCLLYNNVDELNNNSAEVWKSTLDFADKHYTSIDYNIIRYGLGPAFSSDIPYAHIYVMGTVGNIIRIIRDVTHRKVYVYSVNRGHVIDILSNVKFVSAVSNPVYEADISIGCLSKEDLGVVDREISVEEDGSLCSVNYRIDRVTKTLDKVVYDYSSGSKEPIALLGWN